MARKAITVAELAELADLEIDTVLVTLWGAGIEHPDSASSRLSDAERRLAQKVLGAAGAHQRKVEYWLDWLGVDRAGFADILRDLGFTLDARAKTVPKNAVRKLRKLPAAEVGALEETTESPDVTVPPPTFPVAPTGPVIQPLSVDEVIAIHRALEEDFFRTDDPISPPGIRDIGLLASAVDRQTTKFGDTWKFGTVELVGAALLHGLVNNHPFHNGNKRTALVSLLVFLDKNGRLVESDQDELFREMVKIAAHEILEEGPRYIARADHEVLAISSWIAKRSRAIRKDERIVPWRVVRGLLRDQGCTIDEGKGQRAYITRVVKVKPERGLLKWPVEKTLRTSYVNTGDGRNVPRAQLKRIRQDLWLDEPHGIDSEQFYVQSRQPDDFIQEYSKILRRLARV